jgi:hypothetical protein
MRAGSERLGGYCSALGGVGSRGEGSASFLKKRSKKLLSLWSRSVSVAPHANGQKFFASFFQKRSACFLAESHPKKASASFFEKKKQKTFTNFGSEAVPAVLPG